jgi:Protein of unknown function (DUF1761)
MKFILLSFINCIFLFVYLFLKSKLKKIMNWIAIAISTIIPLVLGFGWYHKALFGNAWMQASNMTLEDAKKINMPLVMGILLVFSFFLSMGMLMSVIHQMHLGSLIANLPDADGSMKADVDMMMAKYGNNFRTFKHGALHGFLTSIFVALPIISFSALFEGKKGKYIAIHWGFWAVSMMLMGGVLSAMK